MTGWKWFCNYFNHTSKRKKFPCLFFHKCYSLVLFAIQIASPSMDVVLLLQQSWRSQSLEETLTRGSLVAASSVKCWYASVYKPLLRSIFVMADPSKRAWFGSKSEDLAKHSSSYYPIKNKVSNLLSVTDSRHFWSKQHFSSLTSSLLNILWEKLCSKC